MENEPKITEEQRMLAIIENQADITGWHIGGNSTMKAMIFACMEIYADYRLSALEAANQKLREALQIIANPIKHLQDEAKHQRYNLNGVNAVKIANSADYLKSIAEQALKKDKL